MTSIPLSDLSGNAAPAAKFEAVGDKYVGTITQLTRRQQTEFSTNKPLFFESGDPRMETVITIDTTEGERTLYARGGNYEVGSGEGLAMENAIGAAAVDAGVTSLEIGAKLAVAHSGLGKPKPGLNPPKLFVAQYQPPVPDTAKVPVDDLFG